MFIQYINVLGWVHMVIYLHTTTFIHPRPISRSGYTGWWKLDGTEVGVLIIGAGPPRARSRGSPGEHARSGGRAPSPRAGDWLLLEARATPGGLAYTTVTRGFLV